MEIGLSVIGTMKGQDFVGEEVSIIGSSLPIIEAFYKDLSI